MKKLLTFALCLALGITGFIAVEFFKPFNPELRAADPAPATKCTFGISDTRQVTMPTQYVVVAPYVTEADLKRVPQVSEKERRAEFDSKTIAR